MGVSSASMSEHHVHTVSAEAGKGQCIPGTRVTGYWD